MDTQIYLYRVPISRNRNCRIDGILQFLSLNSKAKKSNEHCGYVAIDYRIAVSLSMPQANVGKLPYNYCRIYQDNRNYYYFINKATWMSKQSVALTMTLDTINTFWDDFKWSSKTSIIREHRDRWTVDNKRLIDRFNEGLQPALDKLTSPTKVPTASNAFSNYGKLYLVWLSNAEITPDKQTATPIIPCLLTQTKYQYSAATTYSQRSFEPNTYMSPGKSMFITDSVNPNSEFLWSVGSILCHFGHDTDEGAILRAVRIVCTATNTYTFERYYYTGDRYPYSFKKKVTRSGDLGPSITVQSGYGLNYGYLVDSTAFVNELTNLVQIDAFSPYYLNLGSTTALNVEGFNSFDRSSTYISSMLEIPYAPVSIESYVKGFIPGFNLLKLDDTSKLQRALKDDGIFSGDLSIQHSKDVNEDPNIKYESKLYSSEFYQRIYTYGDDQEIVRYELFTKPITSLSILWSVSSYMTNDFSFRFDFGTVYEKMDVYGEYMFVSEASQIPLYNSSYLDYIRNGYNYDSYINKKNNQLSIINAIGNGLATGASMLGGGAIGAGYVAGRAIQYGLQGISAISAVDSNNRQFRNIVNEKAAASPTTVGNSSIDLRPYNYLAVYTKTVRDEVRKQIFWKFYYTGYLHPFQEVPDFTSRYWFNYVECYPVFKEEEASVYGDFLDEIRGRFQEGVTVFHNHNNVWNIDQDKENVEEVLL